MENIKKEDLIEITDPHERLDWLASNEGRYAYGHLGDEHCEPWTQDQLLNKETGFYIPKPKEKRPITMEEFIESAPYRIKWDGVYPKAVLSANRNEIFIGSLSFIKDATIAELIEQGATYDTIKEPNIWRSFEVSE